MAEVIQLTRRRLDLAGRQALPHASETASTTLYFDLASPYTYLVAERVERRVGGATWRPATLQAPPPRGEQLVAEALGRAHALRMPLVWPERFPARVPAAMRVATCASEHGCAGAFAVAAGRLAFCGGFDLEDPEIIAEAAAAAGLDVEEALVAARDPRRDHQIAMAGRSIEQAGGMALPALEHEQRLYCGEAHITAWLSQLGALARPSAS
ncbi:MAG TPA: DsbA family protein [Conexibacter sp.]|nr:DsbA family protein [Conexibacter sp.]